MNRFWWKLVPVVVAATFASGACAETTPQPVAHAADAAGDTADAGFGTASAGAEGEPTIAIVSPVDNAKFTYVSPGVTLEFSLSVTNAEVSDDAFHVLWYLDGVPLEETASAAPFTITEIPHGRHHVAARLVYADGSVLPNATSLDGIHVKVEGLCDGAGDCQDGLVCSAEQCIGGGCGYGPVAGCCDHELECPYGWYCIDNGCQQCVGESDCDDGNACTVDICDVNGACVHEAITGCCTTDAECDDGSACTEDLCDSAAQTCSHTPSDNPECCDTVDDCEVPHPCMTALCYQNTDTDEQYCRYGPLMPNCCEEASDCQGGTVCDIAQCEYATPDAEIGSCQYVDDPAQPTCCLTHQDCDDGDPSTVDKCLDNACANAPDPMYCELPVTSPMVITELMVAGGPLVPDTDAEWFELYNATAEVIDLTGWTLTTSNGESHTLSPLNAIGASAGMLVPPGGYWVAARRGKSLNGGFVPNYTYGEAISLPDPIEAQGGFSMTLVLTDANGALVDTVTYTEQLPFEDGHSVALRHPHMANGEVDSTRWGVSGRNVSPYFNRKYGKPALKLWGEPRQPNLSTYEGVFDDSCPVADGAGLCAEPRCGLDSRCELGIAKGCCTSDLHCATGDTCLVGSCDFATNACNVPELVEGCCTLDDECDDGNPCNLDRCLGNSCRYSPNVIPSCCESEADCADGDVCTVSACDPVTHTCQPAQPLIPPMGFTCCNDEAECDDGDPATYNLCDGGTNLCLNPPIDAYCPGAGSDDNCDDGNACTVDFCHDLTCQHVLGGGDGCCQTDADCGAQEFCAEDGTCKLRYADGQACQANSECQNDFCLFGTCSTQLDQCTAAICSAPGVCEGTVALPGCCLTASECDDANPCTLDTCGSNNLCFHQQTPGCCTFDAMCNDGADCTQDSCVDNVCVNVQSQGCCDADMTALELTAICGADPDGDKACFQWTCSGEGACELGEADECCDVDGECVDANSCTLDFCDTSGICKHVVQAGDGCCLVDTDCEADQYCAIDGTCVAKGPDGSGCDNDDQCLSGYCSDEGVCVTPGGPGSGCNVDSDCSIGICADGICCAAPNLGSLGEACDGDDSDQCANGTFQCHPTGLALRCTNETVLDVVESCNGLDDDCDGVPDNGLTAPPATKQGGICGTQSQICGGAAGWQDPDFTAIPAFENIELSCDGVDNDCDGFVDNGIVPPAANLTNGVCVGSVKVCGGTEGWLEPDYTDRPAFEATESLCDGLDNDCDGEADNGLTAPTAEAAAGVCVGAVKVCAGFGGWQEPDLTAIAGYEAEELSCDGLDNDCDGIADNLANAPVADLNQGVCTGQRKVCDGAGGWVEPDYTALSGFQEAELSCDGVDNDCDGQVDNGLTAPAASRVDGVCVGSVKLCMGEAGWQDPTFSALSGFETIEATCDGLDNDCDGQVDNSLAAPPATKTLGVCVGQVQVCDGAGGWVDPDFTAIAGYEAVELTCDGIDNDCDGQVDNALTAPLADKATGACASAVKVCAGSAGWVEPDYTAIAGYEAVELTCDGIDNDCDGAADDGLTAPKADLTKGVCDGAVKVCGGAAGWVEPDYTAIATYEAAETSCDGRDNDCDGLIDQGLTAPAADKTAGVCSGAVKVCMGGQGWQEPNYQIFNGYEDVETRCDGLDNDCSGEADTGLTAPLSLKQEGVCAGTLQVCAGAAGWQEPDYTSVTGFELVETACDGIDSNCDGQADEAFNVGFGCSTDPSATCFDGTIVCDTADPGATVCDMSAAGSGVEVCDGLDNDCDGTPDNGLTAPVASLNEGVCAGLVKACGGSAGWVDPDFAAVSGFEAIETSCDGLDNDCDGNADVFANAPLAANQQGVCDGNRMACDPAQGFVEPDAALSAFFESDEVSCDTLDNDCDGYTDEGLCQPDLGDLDIYGCDVEVLGPTQVFPWEVSAIGTCDWAPYGEVSVIGTIGQQDTVTDVYWCLGAIINQDYGPFRLIDTEVMLCKAEDGTVTGTLEGTVGIEEHTSDVTGTWTLTDPWSMQLSVTNIPIAGFDLEQITIMYEEARSYIGVDADLAFGQDDGDLQLALAGDFYGSGDFSLTAGLQDGTFWTPIPGLDLDFSEVSGSLSRTGGVEKVAVSATADVAVELVDGFVLDEVSVSAEATSEGAWTTTLGAQAELGPLGLVGVSGTLSQAGPGEPLTGCLTANIVGPVDVLGLITLKDIDLAICVDADGRVGIDLDGVVEVAGEDYDFLGTLYFSNLDLTGEPEGFEVLEDWALVVRIPTFTVGSFTLANTRFELQESGAHIDLYAEMAFPVAADQLAIVVDGEYLPSGDWALDVAMQDGTTWAPFSGLDMEFDLLSGSFSRTAGMLAMSVTATATGEVELVEGLTLIDAGVTANWAQATGAWAIKVFGIVDMPILGMVALTGSLSQAGPGDPITGCLGGQQVGDAPVTGLFTLHDVSVDACIDTDGNINVAMGGEVTIFGDRMGFPSAQLTISVEAAITTWTLRVDLPSFTLGGFTLDGGYFLLDKGASFVELHADMTLDVAGSSLPLSVTGSYQDTGDFSITVGLQDGESWQPFASFDGFVFTALTGTWARSGGVQSFSLSATSALALEILPGFTLDSAFVNASWIQGGGWSLELGGTASLPVLGTLSVVGTVEQAAPGAPITGCLVGTQAGDIDALGLFTMHDLGVSVCLDATETVRIEFTGQVTIFGQTLGLPGGRLTLGGGVGGDVLGGAWSLEIDLPPFSVEGFELLQGRLVLLDGADSVQLSAEMNIDIGGSTLPLILFGDYQGATEWAFGIGVQPGASWQPISAWSGLVFTELGGQMSQSGGVFSLQVTANSDLAIQVAPGLSLAGLDFAATYASDGTWAFSIAATANLPVVGTLTLGGNVAQAGPGAPVTGCLFGTLDTDLDVAGLLTLHQLGVEVCMLADETVTIGLTGEVSTMGGTYVMASAEIVLPPASNPSLGWELRIFLPPFTLGPFTLNSGRVVLSQNQGFLGVTANMTLDVGGAPLGITVDGSYEASGDFSFSVMLNDGETWQPIMAFDDLVFTSLSGTIQRVDDVISASINASIATTIDLVPSVTMTGASVNATWTEGGAWSFGLGGSANLPLIGALTVYGEVSQAGPGEPVTGCLEGSQSGDIDLFGLATMHNLDVGFCLASDGAFGISLAGSITVFGSTFVFPGATLVVEPNGTWHLEIGLPSFTLGGFTFIEGTIRFEDNSDVIGVEATLELDVAGQPLTLDVAGEYAGADWAFSLGLAEGTTWQPVAAFDQLVFTELSGSVSRTAGVTRVSLSATADLAIQLVEGLTITGATVQADWVQGGEWSVQFGGSIDLPLLGTLVVLGTVEQAAPGEPVTGCLAGTLVGPIDAFGLFTLNDLAVGVCVNADETMEIGFSGSITAFGGITMTFPSARILLGAIAGTWSVEIELPPFTLGGFTLDSALIQIDEGGAAMQVDAAMTIDVLGQVLPLNVGGAYTADGDFVLYVALQDGQSWAPLSLFPGLTFTEIAGSFRRASGVLAFDFSASADLELELAPGLRMSGITVSAAWAEGIGWQLSLSGTAVMPVLGTVSLAGTVAQNAGTGAITGCLSGSMSGPVDVFGILSFSDVALQLCVDDSDAVTISFEGNIGLFGGDYSFVNATLVLQQGDVEDWELSVSLPSFNVLGFTLQSATLRITDGGEHVAITAAVAVDVLGDTLPLTLVGNYDASGDFDFAIQLQTGQSWTPLAAWSGLTFTSASGAFERTAGVWAFAFDLSVGLDVEIASGFYLRGASLAVAYDQGGSWDVTLGATMELPFLGGFAVVGDLMQNPGGPVHGCLTATLTDDIDVLGALTLSGLEVEACLDEAGATAVTFDGQIAIFGGTYDIPSATFSWADADLTGTWTLTMELPAFTLGPVSFDGGRLVVLEGGSNVQFIGEMTLDLGSTLQLVVTGTYLGGDFSFQVAMKDGTTWTPIPQLSDITFTTLSGGFAKTGATWSFNIAASITNLELEIVPGFTLREIGASATMTTDGDWSFAIHGTTDVELGDSSFTLQVTAAVNSDGELAFTGQYIGEIQPLAFLVGDGVFTVRNPSITFTVTLGGSWSLYLEAPVSLCVLGTCFDLIARAGMQGGQSTSLWFSGLIPALDLPGLGTIGSVAFVVNTGALNDFDLFNTPMDASDDLDLEPGFTLVASAPSPIPLTADEGPLLIIISIQGPTSFEAKAQLPWAWQMIGPEDDFPGVDHITLGPLSLFVRFNGSDVAMGFEGVVSFRPDNQTTDILGVVEIYLTAMGDLGVYMALEGMWQEPFGFEGFAIQNFGLTFDLNLATGVPVPTALGFNGDIFWKKSGDWPDPAVVDLSDVSVPTPSNLARIGASFYFSKNVSPSGLCFVGACVPLPPFLFRIQVDNLGLSDFFAVTNDVRRGVMAPFGNSLPSVDIPEISLSPVEFEINNFLIYASTHTLNKFGGTFPAGFRVDIDVDIMGVNVIMKGFLDSSGLLLEAQITPFTLLGVTLAGDPFRRYVQLGASGSVLVPQDTRLDATKTFEAWIEDFQWGGTNIVAQRQGDYVISVGNPDDNGYGRVSVQIGSYIARTIDGVIPPGERTHLGVVFYPTGTMIYVNGGLAFIEHVNAKQVPSGGGHVIMGIGLMEMDDIRFWNDFRHPAELRGEGRVLPLGYVNDGSLIARYDSTYDNDGEGVLYNDRYHGSYPDTQQLHGVYQGGATSVLDTANQELYFKLNIEVPPEGNFAESGLWLQAGLDVDWPLGIDFTAMANIGIMAGNAAGEFRATPIPLRIIPFIGTFYLSGAGPNLNFDDYDDGPYGAFDLLGLEFAASISLEFDSPYDMFDKRLGYGSLFFGCPNGEVCDSITDHVLKVDAGIDLTVPMGTLGNVGIQGTFKFDTEDFLIRVNGQIVVLDFTLASATIEMDDEHILVQSMIDLPTVAGVDLGQALAEAEITYDPFMLRMLGTVSLSLPFLESNVSGTFEFRVGAENWFHFEVSLSNIGIAGFGLNSAVVRVSTKPGLEGIYVEGDIDLAVVSARLIGQINSSGFLLEAWVDIGLAGFTLAGAHVRFSNAGFLVEGELNFLGNSLDVVVSINADGTFLMEANATLGILGFTLANAFIRLDNSGLYVSAGMSLLGGAITASIAGSIQSNGQFSLEGSASISIGGFSLASGFLRLDNSGVYVSGQISVAGINASMTGHVYSNGSFSITGTASITLAGFTLASASLTLNNTGLFIDVRLDVGPIDLFVTGYFLSNGQFSLTGSTSVNVAGFGFGVSVTLNNSGVTAAGSVNIPGLASVNVTARIYTNGSFEFTGSFNMTVLGYTLANASFRLSNSGASIAVYVNLGIFKANVAGSVYSNGNFSLSGSAQLSIPVPGGTWNIASAAFLVQVWNGAVTFEAKGDINVLGNSVEFGAEIRPSGWRFYGSADLGIGPFTLVGADLDISSNNGMFARGMISIIIAFVEVSGYINPDWSFLLKTAAGVPVNFLGGAVVYVEFERKSNGHLRLGGGIDIAINGIATVGGSFWVSTELKFFFEAYVSIGVNMPIPVGVGWHCEVTTCVLWVCGCVFGWPTVEFDDMWLGCTGKVYGTSEGWAGGFDLDCKAGSLTLGRFYVDIGCGSIGFTILGIPVNSPCLW